MGKNKKSFEDKILDKLEEWTDEKVLEHFILFLDRVNIATKFIDNEDDLIVGEILVMNSGDKVIVSEAREFSWPLQYLPVPEALEGKLN